jgi:hypothetical protein
VPMQEIGDDLTESWLRRVRDKCDPDRETLPQLEQLEPTDEMCVFIRENTALPNAQLRVAVNKKLAAVRRAPRAPVRARASAHPQAGRRGRGGCAGAGARSRALLRPAL